MIIKLIDVMIDILLIITMIASTVAFILAFVNYSILCSTETSNLNWLVKETFYALSTLSVIILAEAVLFALSISGIVKIIVDLASVFYILIFNVVLLYTILDSKFKLKFCKDAIQIPFYIALLWIIFEEKLKSDPIIVEVAVVMLIVSISAVLLKLLRYIKILKMIVEPVDMKSSLLAFLVFMMLYTTSTLAEFYDLNVARSMLVVSLIMAIISMVLLDLAIKKTVCV